MGDDNIWTDTWGEGEDWSGGGARAKRLPRGDELGATVYELGPGNWLPFHFHHGAEEYLVVPPVFLQRKWAGDVENQR